MRRYYIYALTYESVIFYVGITTDPLGRYGDHISKRNSTCVKTNITLVNFLRNVNLFGEVPEMDIIDTIVTKSRYQAESLEKKHIRELKPICNMRDNELKVKPSAITECTPPPYIEKLALSKLKVARRRVAIQMAKINGESTRKFKIDKTLGWLIK